MEVRQFRARSLQDALTQVRRELGPAAAVVQSRQVWDGWWKGIWGCRRVEVTAVLELPHGAVVEGDGDLPHSCKNPCQVPASSGRCTEPPVVRSDQAFRLYTELVEREFSDEMARRIAGQIEITGRERHESQVPAAFHRLVQNHVPCRAGLEPQLTERSVVAFVGPTGVGKTTTIAKLAAHFQLRKKQNVGLITVDTYRIAAVDQLRTYAEIMDLPVEVVSTPREMREAVDRLKDCDLVLIDTAGRSPQDVVHLRELNSMIAEADATDVLLVLSATCHSSVLRRFQDAFSPARTTAIVLTKLDELGRLGSIYEFLDDCPLPLIYLANGQTVPDDIRVAEPDVIATWLWQGQPGVLT